MLGSDILTNSRLDAFQHCRAYHHFTYVLGIRPEPSDALRFGGIIHKAIEVYHWYRMQGLSSGTAEVEAQNAIDANYQTLIGQAQTQELVEKLSLEWTKAQCMFSGWAWRWQDTRIEIVEAEQRLVLPIINPETGRPTPTFRFAGKLDAIIRLEDQRLSLYEAKTTGEDIAPDSLYWRVLRLDAQISRYVGAARQLGFDLETILYDVIRKPELYPKQIPLLDDDGLKIVLNAAGERIYNERTNTPRQTGDAEKGFKLQTRTETNEEYAARLMVDIQERPDFYFQRREISRVEADLTEAAAEVWDLQRDINEAIKTGRHYKNVRACRRWNGLCPFFDPVCSVGRDLTSGEIPEGFVRVENIHPELEAQNEPNPSDNGPLGKSR